MSEVSQAELRRRQKISDALKGRKKGPRKRVSEEARKAHSEMMKVRWADMSDEKRACIGQRISESLSGKKHTVEHRKANAESRRGKPLSQEQRKKISRSLCEAYEEGRRSSWNTGMRVGSCSEETKKKISDSLRRASQEGRLTRCPWNQGKRTGPRPKEVRRKISESLRGRSHSVSPEKREAWRQKISTTKRGARRSAEACQKTSESLRRAYAEGRRGISVKSGYGKGSYYDTPFQGKKWLRSTSEVQRARELDQAGIIWFYELRKFVVELKGHNSTYTPDFWIVEDLKREAVSSAPSLEDFINEMETSGRFRIEDVKGWWGPTHKTFKKISAFQEQYPRVPFRIVVREGLFRERATPGMRWKEEEQHAGQSV